MRVALAKFTPLKHPSSSRTGLPDDRGQLLRRPEHLLRHEARHEEALQAQQEGIQATVGAYRTDTAGDGVAL